MQSVLNWISHVMSRNISHVLVIRANFSIFQKKKYSRLVASLKGPQIEFDEKKQFDVVLMRTNYSSISEMHSIINVYLIHFGHKNTT